MNLLVQSHGRELCEALGLPPRTRSIVVNITVDEPITQCSVRVSFSLDVKKNPPPKIHVSFHVRPLRVCFEPCISRDAQLHARSRNHGPPGSINFSDDSCTLARGRADSRRQA
jgi:hypothetical protein